MNGWVIKEATIQDSVGDDGLLDMADIVIMVARMRTLTMMKNSSKLQKTSSKDGSEMTKLCTPRWLVSLITPIITMKLGCSKVNLCHVWSLFYWKYTLARSLLNTTIKCAVEIWYAIIKCKVHVWDER